ncbi:CAP domain-containing protein [Patulibacter defluvii]|uniref:CAP domain-containing protein n=1 Tax=Patulibacter defluvii TaxID=3095358 RepID=UPI002A764350|nr:CAP domain-containing protein [Patulibacter sp. DM4]
MPLNAPLGTAATTLVLLLAAAPSAGAACADADRRATPGALPEVRAATLCLIGERRAAAGVPPLRVQATLQRLSRSYARQMVRRGFFSHTSPGGATLVDRLRAAGYARRGHRWQAAENLAWATGSRATPRRIVASWMASPQHRANLLARRYRETGLAIVTGTPQPASGQPRVTVVQQFGVRK